MKILTLKRLSYTHAGTFGALLDSDEIPFALTLEREWADNMPNISCIPFGIYECKRVISPRFGETFEILNVMNRTHILFHKGNVEKDSRGCILIGEKFEKLGNRYAILESRHGFNEFMGKLLNIDLFMLHIKDA